MRYLPLYPDGLPSLVERTTPLPRNDRCTRCELSAGVKTVCLPAAGEPGGLFTVGMYPGAAEDQHGIPNVGPAGRYLHEQIQQRWSGPIAHGNTLACKPRDTTKINPKWVAACRPYLAEWIRVVRPTRILALGDLAIQGLLGRSPSVNSVRRGFAWYEAADWLEDETTPRPTYDDRSGYGAAPRPPTVPIIYLMHPAAALRQGRFAQRAFEDDLEWALTTPDSFFQERHRFLRSGVVQVVETLSEAEETFAQYREAVLADDSGHTAIVHDVETRGRLHDPKTFKLVSVALCLNGSNVATVLDRHALAKGCAKPYGEALHDPALRWVEQGQYDDRVAMYLFGGGRPLGIAGERRDVRLLRKLIDTTADGDLDSMSELVGQGGFKSENSDEMKIAREQVLRWSPRQSEMFDECPDPEARSILWREIKAGRIKTLDQAKAYLFALIPTDTLSVYNARDDISTGLLDRWAYPVVLSRPNLRMIWQEVEQPASLSFAASEYWGVPIDKDRCEQSIWFANDQQRQLEPHLRKYCGPSLNLASGKQIAAFLFGPPPGGLGITPIKKTKKTKAAATSKEAIAAVADAHPFCRLFAQYAHWDRLKEKAQEFLQFLTPDGRVHPAYLIDGTVSGRGSCKAPNLYSIKRAVDHKACDGKGCDGCDDTGIDEESRRERDCIAAPPGWKIVEIDLSQIELRGMAAVSGDRFMTEAFVNDEDLHQKAADAASAKARRKIERSPTAKMINFGSGYDLTEMGLAQRLDLRTPDGELDIKTAAQLQHAVLGNYVEMLAAKTAAKKRALECGYATTVWGPDFREGRHRVMFELGDEDDYKREDALRAVWATKIQGSYSGDKVKEAHAQLVRWIIGRRLDSVMQLILSIYDSLIGLVRDDYVKLFSFMGAQFMLRVPLGNGVPQACDVKVGQTYGLCKKAKLPKTLAEAMEGIRR